MSDTASPALTLSCPSVFRVLRKGFQARSENEEKVFQDFKRMISGQESLFGLYSGIGSVKLGKKMTINNTVTRTTASVSWQEAGRLYATYFVLEDENPVPSSIIDLSHSLR